MVVILEVEYGLAAIVVVSFTRYVLSAGPPVAPSMAQHPVRIWYTARGGAAVYRYNNVYADYQRNRTLSEFDEISSDNQDGGWD
jgi:hypothetical protein